MLSRNPTEDIVDVLIIDNMSGQAKAIQSALERDGLKATSFVLSVCSEGNETRRIPRSEIDRVMSVIAEQQPGIVLVDICLDETLFDTAEEKHATWTGPALMSEIRARVPDQKMASYSAYARYVEIVDKDIEDQRKHYLVGDTPHWSATEITADVIRRAMS
jgi:hypothetical protein